MVLLLDTDLEELGLVFVSSLLYVSICILVENFLQNFLFIGKKA